MRWDTRDLWYYFYLLWSGTRHCATGWFNLVTSKIKYCLSSEKCFPLHPKLKYFCNILDILDSKSWFTYLACLQRQSFKKYLLLNWRSEASTSAAPRTPIQQLHQMLTHSSKSFLSSSQHICRSQHNSNSTFFCYWCSLQPGWRHITLTVCCETILTPKHPLSALCNFTPEHQSFSRHSIFTPKHLHPTWLPQDPMQICQWQTIHHLFQKGTKY